MTSDRNALYQQLLVVRSQLGDRAAMEELVGMWERRLLYYIRRLVPAEQDALQVMQEVWVKVLSGLGRLNDPARLAPWLYSLTRYTVIDHMRDSYTRRELLSKLQDQAANNAAGAETDDGIERFDDAEQIHYGLSRVSLVDREVLTLYFLDDLSVNDVAEVLNIPPGTVKSRLYHARKALSAVLAEREGTNE